MDARHLLDQLPQGKKGKNVPVASGRDGIDALPDGVLEQGKKGKNVPVASGRDGIDALPDGVLEQILGFLPAEEAGRTSVLAQRWRHLWKSATPLRISCNTDEYLMPPADLKERQKNVDDMLRLRGHTPLEACEITFGSADEDDDVFCLNRWVQHVVMCRVKRLRFENIYYGQPFELEDLPLVSRHLTKLELAGVVLSSDFCDFSSCPSLEHLELTNCYLWNVKKLSSESVKHLSLTICDFDSELHAFIFVPCLVYLKLDSHLWRTPLLGRMPLLKMAFVRFPIETNYSSDCENDDCYSCHNMVDDNKCFLLDGLSNAKNLALLSESLTFIFERELKQCPTFSYLKNLLLDDHWCVAPDFLALTCILKHSPVLEKLTLQLYSRGPNHKVEIIGMYCPMDRPTTMLEHLKAIEVKCEVVDEKVHKVLQFLCKFNFCFIFK